MKTLSKRPLDIFNKLVQLAEQNNGHVKIDNTPGCMAVHVEILLDNTNYKFVSIAHYYIQEGDMMRDPDIVFAINKHNPDEVFPVEYRQDALGIHRAMVTFNEKDEATSVMLKEQAKTATFCTMWFDNIKQQQGL